MKPALYKNLPFDPTKDFTLISYHAQVPYLLLANTQLPVKNYEEFIAYLKENTADRLKLFRDVPTLQQVGVDIDDAASYRLVGPAGLPDEVVEF